MLYTETFRFPGASVRIDSVVKCVLTELTRVYRCFLGPGSAVAEPTFVFGRHKGELRFVRKGSEDSDGALTVERGRVAALVEPIINRYLAETLGDHLLLHAAVAAHGERAVILPGVATSGKTTLVAGLVERGYAYLTDELAIIDRGTRRVIPFPKAMSLKEGSCSLFQSYGPQPSGAPGQRVWHLDPDQLRPGCVADKPLPLGWVCLPRYQAGAETRMEPLTVGETVLGLFENTVNTARHETAGLDLLIDMAQAAPGYRLVTGDLDQACKAVLHLTGGAGTSCS